ncbi:MAG: peptidylprolyl isomerase [Deltaproteobacteria bacterium]
MLLSAGLLISGCDNIVSTLSPAPKPTGTIVAKVDNNYYITSDQLDQEIENLNAIAQIYGGTPKVFTKEEKAAFLKDELVPRYLIYKEAKAKGLDKLPKVQEALLNAAIKVVDEQYLKKQADAVQPTNQEIEAFYNTYKEQFRQAEERRIREIMVNTEDEAKEIMIDLLKGSDFAAIASQKSQAKSASKGGDLGYIGRGTKGDDKKFDDVVFSSTLEVNQVSPVFKGNDGYYIVRLEGVRGGQVTPLNEVWEQVKNAMVYYKQQQKMQELKDNLSKKAKIEVYQEKIK